MTFWGGEGGIEVVWGGPEESLAHCVFLRALRDGGRQSAVKEMVGSARSNVQKREEAGGRGPGLRKNRWM